MGFGRPSCLLHRAPHPRLVVSAQLLPPLEWGAQAKGGQHHVFQRTHLFKPLLQTFRGHSLPDLHAVGLSAFDQYLRLKRRPLPTRPTAASALQSIYNRLEHVSTTLEIDAENARAHKPAWVLEPCLRL